MLWRGEHMSLVQLFVQTEAAFETMMELGALGCLQFNDLNKNISAFQRHFAADVKRAEELERRIRFLESQLAARRFRLNKGEAVDVEMNELTTLELLEARLEEEEHALREAMSGFEGLRQSRDELQELMAVLTTADEMLSMSKSEAAKQPLISGGAGGGGSGAAAAAASAAAKRADKKKRGKGYAEESLDQPLLAADAAAAEEGRGGGPGATLGGGGGSGSLSFVTGVIGERGRLQSLERVLWRATRGNLFFRSGPAAHAEDTHVFVVLFQGAAIEGKVRKIAGAFGARLYACPESPVVREQLAGEVAARLQEMGVVLGRSSARLDQMMHRVAERIDGWRERVLKGERTGVLSL